MPARAVQIAVVLTTALIPAVTMSAAPESPDRRVVLVAHRGGFDHGYPENTLAAFRHAIGSGVEAIEIDLRATRDGELVVIHDETVDRTTDGRGEVAEASLAELRRLDAGGGERIPTFEEVLRLVAGAGVLLVFDVKKGAATDHRRVVRLIESYGMFPNAIVGLRTLDDLRAYRALKPELRTLAFVEQVEDIETFAAAGAGIIRLWPEWMAAYPGLVDRVHRLGKPVWVTAGDASRDELERLIEQGVDGILSNRPDELNALRADLRRKDP